MRIHLDRSTARWDTSLEQFHVGLNTKLSGIQTMISGCATLQERNSALLFQIAAESNQAVIKQIIEAQFSLLRSNLGNVATGVADRMTGGIPVPQTQTGGTVAGSPPICTYPGTFWTPTSAQQGVPYPGFGYKMPIVRSGTALWNAWYGLKRYKNTPICGGIDALES